MCREEDGQPYHPQTVSRRLGRLSQQAGVPRLTAHGLRHTSATLMQVSGVHPKVAAERLGHASAGLFMALYSHVTPTVPLPALRGHLRGRHPIPAEGETVVSY